VICNGSVPTLFSNTKLKGESTLLRKGRPDAQVNYRLSGLRFYRGAPNKSKRSFACATSPAFPGTQLHKMQPFGCIGNQTVEAGVFSNPSK